MEGGVEFEPAPQPIKMIEMNRRQGMSLAMGCDMEESSDDPLANERVSHFFPKRQDRTCDSTARSFGAIPPSPCNAPGSNFFSAKRAEHGAPRTAILV